MRFIYLLSAALTVFSATAQPDYSNLNYWAAHPLKKDPSDSIPSFITDKTRDTLVDVFFVHPTTFLGLSREWNADVNDQKLNKITDDRTILNQASVFNASGKIYAPRYRQAHFKAFLMEDNKKSAIALDTAYADVKRAFEYYLKHYNHGRPIIIAAHSQGTRHATRLLQEFFDGTALQQQLVCAYLVGFQVKKDAFKHIPIGKQPNSTQCFVTWRSFKPGFVEKDVKNENGNSQCVNPITWKADFEPSELSMHKGGIGEGFSEKYSGAITAVVDETTKVLWVTLPDNVERKFKYIRNYHVADYNLFYFDIRENVKQRVAAFMLR